MGGLGIGRYLLEVPIRTSSRLSQATPEDKVPFQEGNVKGNKVDVAVEYQERPERKFIAN